MITRCVEDHPKICHTKFKKPVKPLISLKMLSGFVMAQAWAPRGTEPAGRHWGAGERAGEW